MLELGLSFALAIDSAALLSFFLLEGLYVVDVSLYELIISAVRSCMLPRWSVLVLIWLNSC